MSTQPPCPACGHDELNGHAICPKCGADAAGMAHFAKKWKRGETGDDGKLRTTLVWTRYDGTPETLPEGGVTVLLARPDWEGEVWDTQFTSGKWYGGRVNTPLEVGDLWAPWPEAPESA